MHTHLPLIHITDVGAPSGNGSDSTLRTLKQYHRCKRDAHIISAGPSPLHIAFTACTDLTPQASDDAYSLYGTITSQKPIYALNSAPRNSTETRADACDDFIHYLVYSDCAFLIYGPDVVTWTLFFCGAPLSFSRITSVSGAISDTSKGTQFRSAHYLPLVHALLSRDETDQRIVRETLTPPSNSAFSLPSCHALILPPDEYGNSRIVLTTSDYDILQEKGSATLHLNDTAHTCTLYPSLTDIPSGKRALWPSSNHLPRTDLIVCNVGTRWAPETTEITCEETLALADLCTKNMGGLIDLS